MSLGRRPIKSEASTKAWNRPMDWPPEEDRTKNLCSRHESMNLSRELFAAWPIDKELPLDTPFGILRSVRERATFCVLCRLISHAAEDVVDTDRADIIGCWIRDGQLEGKETTSLRLRVTSPPLVDGYNTYQLCDIVPYDPDGMVSDLFTGRAMNKQQIDFTLACSWVRKCDEWHGEACRQKEAWTTTAVGVPFIRLLDLKQNCVVEMAVPPLYCKGCTLPAVNFLFEQTSDYFPFKIVRSWVPDPNTVVWQFALTSRPESEHPEVLARRQPPSLRHSLFYNPAATSYVPPYNPPTNSSSSLSGTLSSPTRTSDSQSQHLLHTNSSSSSSGTPSSPTRTSDSQSQPPQTMTTTMPVRGHHTAPKFNGKPEGLHRFFSEVEYLAARAAVEGRDLIRATIGYLDDSDWEIWHSSGDAADGNDWEAFKTCIGKLYPGSDNERRWCPSDLTRIAMLQSQTPMLTKDDLGVYHRKFLVPANWLLAKNSVSNQDVGRDYLSGFDPVTRQKIKDRLAMVHMQHHPDDPYTITEIYTEASFILGSATPASLTGATAAASASPTTPEPVKTESADIRALQSMMQQLMTLQQAQPQYPPPPPQYPYNPTSYYPYPTVPTAQAYAYQPAPPTQPNYPYPAPFQPGPTPQPPQSQQPRAIPPPQSSEQRPPRKCYFWNSLYHTMGTCPDAVRYERNGWIGRNEEGKWIVLPSRDTINRSFPGDSFKEQVDNWMRANNRSQERDAPPHQTVPPVTAPSGVASTNMVEISTFHYAEADESENRAFIEELPSPFDLEEEEKEEIFLQVLMQKMPEVAKKYVTSQKKKDVRFTDPVVTTPSTPARTPTEPVLPPPTSIPFPSTSSRSQLAEAIETGRTTYRPNYRVQSNIENPKAASDVLERALDATLTITQRELLAISYDARKGLRDLISSKRVSAETSFASVNMTSCYGDDDEVVEVLLSTARDPKKECVVASPTQSLRIICPIFNDQYEVECILDTGSQIIAMRRDVFDSLGLMIDIDKFITMESANLSSNQTIGLAHNVKITLGPIDLYLQVQIINDAPYEVLMGRPFFCLTSAVTRDYPDGRQDLTIHDPNSGRCFLIPTFKRIHRSRDVPEHF
ncbi:hypothetical protein EYR36_007275 [Pleurotus pulmonarius]|nr:hypothetical protein EYR36_007275 [Pleurotus pulmonarius]